MNGTRRAEPGSFAFWMLLVCCMKTVICGVEVKGVLGGTAILPCVYSEADPLPDSVSVYWRDKDDRSVLDIVRSLENIKSQNQKFKGRVFSFPYQYSKGNFSVMMKDLKMEDEGLYECEVLRVHFKRKVTLKVSGNRPVLSTLPPTNTAADWSTVHHLICALAGFILF